MRISLGAIILLIILFSIIFGGKNEKTQDDQSEKVRLSATCSDCNQSETIDAFVTCKKCGKRLKLKIEKEQKQDNQTQGENNGSN